MYTILAGSTACAAEHLYVYACSDAFLECRVPFAHNLSNCFGFCMYVYFGHFQLCQACATCLDMHDLDMLLVDMSALLQGVYTCAGFECLCDASVHSCTFCIIMMKLNLKEARPCIYDTLHHLLIYQLHARTHIVMFEGLSWGYC